MKILFLTDTHIRGNAPQNRVDDFPRTLRAKLREAVAIAEGYGVDAVIHGGDLFDSPSPALGVAREMLEVFKQLRVPIYCVAGNHDIFGQNPLTIGRTVIGFIAGLDFLTLMEPGRRYYLQKDGVRVQLTGQHFHYDIDAPGSAGYIVGKRECDAAIHVVHGMLLPKPVLPGLPYTAIDQVAATGADVTLAGHYHLGFPTAEASGRLFINPGALVRLSNHPAEIRRVPQVTLIQIDGGITWEHIPLASALPGEEVLSRTAIEEAEFRQAELNRFIQEVSASGDYHGAGEVEGIVDSIARAHGLPPDVRKEAIRRVSEAQAALGDA